MHPHQRRMAHQNWPIYGDYDPGAFAALSLAGTTHVFLLFLHPIVRQDISHDGLPIVSSAPFTQEVHDQLNNSWDFTTVAKHVDLATLTSKSTMAIS